MRSEPHWAASPTSTVGSPRSCRTLRTRRQSSMLSILLSASIRGRASRRGVGKAGIAPQPLRIVLALASGRPSLRLVSEHADLPSARGGRLGRCRGAARIATAELIARCDGGRANPTLPTRCRGLDESCAIPSREPATGPEKIRFVCATRESQEQFFKKSPLGRSLPFYRVFPPRRRIELRLFKENAEGLPSIYNTAIEEAKGGPRDSRFHPR